MATACGEHESAEGEPTVRFMSIKSFAKALSRRNRELPVLTAKDHPDRLTELAAPAGCGTSNLRQALKTHVALRPHGTGEGTARRAAAAGP